MQRSIKSRAWIVVEEPSPHSSHMTYDLGGDILGDALTGKRPDVILMQYTGLKDKNNKEIYEGDNVKFTEYGHKRLGEVVWEDTHGCWSVRFQFGNLCPMTIMMMSQGLSDFEVIGNIWVGLLKERKD